MTMKSSKHGSLGFACSSTMILILHSDGVFEELTWSVLAYTKNLLIYPCKLHMDRLVLTNSVLLYSAALQGDTTVAEPL